VFVLSSVFKSPTRELDSMLLNSFSDYDDSVYGNE
jgi:hypothetical protein